MLAIYLAGACLSFAVEAVQRRRQTPGEQIPPPGRVLLPFLWPLILVAGVFVVLEERRIDRKLRKLNRRR